MPTQGFAPTLLPTGRPESRGLSSARWRWLLAAPFLVVLAVLLATGWTFRTFWDGDEVSHWALIRWFAEGLPRFKADYPYSATTPFFHLLSAVVVRSVGENLPLVRAFNTLVSIGGVLALFGMLHRTLKHSPATAALLSAVFASSCYFFGYAFRALTDNLAIIGCILAMAALFRFVDPAGPRRQLQFLLGCGGCALAILTRQSYLFLCLPFAVLLLASDLPVGAKLVGVAALGLALVPFAGLVVALRGVGPPDFQVHHTPSPINFYPLALPLMVLGLYVPFFFGPDLGRAFRAGSLDARRCVRPAFGVAAAVAVLVFFPLFPVTGRPELTPYFPSVATVDFSKYFAGSIYAVVDRTPRLSLCHNHLLFWFALPMGAAAAAWLVPSAWHAGGSPHRRVAAWFLLSVLLSSTLNSVSSQKYYDGLVLLFLVWHVRGDLARDAWRRGALLCLIGGFLAYAVVQPWLSKTRDFQATPLAPPPPHP